MKRLSEKEFREYSLSGNLYKLLVQVGTPLAVFAVFNSLFSILDTMMTSHLGIIDVSTVAYMSQLRMIHAEHFFQGLIHASSLYIAQATSHSLSDKALQHVQ